MSRRCYASILSDNSSQTNCRSWDHYVCNSLPGVQRPEICTSQTLNDDIKCVSVSETEFPPG